MAKTMMGVRLFCYIRLYLHHISYIGIWNNYYLFEIKGLDGLITFPDKHGILCLVGKISYWLHGF